MSLSAKPLGNHPAPTTFKLACNGETRRVAAPSSWEGLQAICASFWGDNAFCFTYTDEEGDKVVVSSAPEFSEAQAVACALGKAVFKLDTYPSHEALRASLLPLPPLASGPAAAANGTAAGPMSGTTAGPPGGPVHWGIECDRSGMCPIVGPRYHVLGNNYDLCQAEFNLLPESERVLYVKISHPGAHPEPCLPADAAEAPGMAPAVAAQTFTKGKSGRFGRARGGGCSTMRRAGGCDRHVRHAPYQRLAQCGVPIGAVLQRLARDHGLDLDLDDLAAQASIAASYGQHGDPATADGADNADGTPLVNLFAAFMGPEAAAATATAAAQPASQAGSGAKPATNADPDLTPGARVKLQGLGNCNIYNGALGTVLDKYASSGGGRDGDGGVLYRVKVDSPEDAHCVMSLHAANLRPVHDKIAPSPPSAPAGITDAASGAAALPGSPVPAARLAGLAATSLLSALAGGGGDDDGCDGFKFGGHGGGGRGAAHDAAVHYSVTCDRSGMCPIVGPRYHVLGNNYDLCQAEFNLLPESERVLYVKISHPGAHPEPCLPADAAEAPGVAAAAVGAEAKAPPEPVAAASAAAASATAASARGTAEEAAALPKPEEQGPAAPPTPPVSPPLVASWVQLASESEEPAKPKAPAGATAAAGAASTDEAEALTAAKNVEDNAEDIEGEFAGEVAELRALGLVGEGPGGAAVAVRALQLHQGRLDATVNALLDGR